LEKRLIWEHGQLEALGGVHSLDGPRSLDDASMRFLPPLKQSTAVADGEVDVACGTPSETAVAAYHWHGDKMGIPEGTHGADVVEVGWKCRRAEATSWPS